MEGENTPAIEGKAPLSCRDSGSAAGAVGILSYLYIKKVYIPVSCLLPVWYRINASGITVNPEESACREQQEHDTYIGQHDTCDRSTTRTRYTTTRVTGARHVPDIPRRVHGSAHRVQQHDTYIGQHAACNSTTRTRYTTPRATGARHVPDTPRHVWQDHDTYLVYHDTCDRNTTRTWYTHDTCDDTTTRTWSARHVRRHHAAYPGQHAACSITTPRTRVSTTCAIRAVPG